MVARRVYAIGYVGIAGFGRPRWSVVADEDYADYTPEEPKEHPTVDGLPILRKGDKGELVKSLKALLIVRGYGGGFKSTNPNFGVNVEKAVKKLQADNDLEVDGEAGQFTWAAALGL